MSDENVELNIENKNVSFKLSSKKVNIYLGDEGEDALNAEIKLNDDVLEIHINSKGDTKESKASALKSNKSDFKTNLKSYFYWSNKR